MKNIGKTIKYFRLKKGLKQKDLARLSSISVSHLCLMEKENREPSLSSLESIALALELPLSILVFFAAQQDDLNEFSHTQIEKLSENIKELLDFDYKQQALF